jgi:hypothetical protein
MANVLSAPPSRMRAMSKAVFNCLPAHSLDRQVEGKGVRAWEDGSV